MAIEPKNRIELAQLFKELGFTKGAEIGVCDGRYSEILCQTLPDLEMIGIDPYHPYEVYADFRRQSTHDKNYLQARDRMQLYPKYVFMVTTSVEAAKWIQDESLDFVFIDGNHEYDFVKEDIEAWVPKVRKGGIVSGHDYYEFNSGRGGVVKAVDEYAQTHGYKVQSTGWSENVHRDDRQPDWLFVK